MRLIVVIIFLTFFHAFLDAYLENHEKTNRQQETLTAQQKADSANELKGIRESDNKSSSNSQMGTVTSTLSGRKFSTQELWKIVNHIPQSKRYHYRSWSDRRKREYTGSAPGVNKLTYFANSFLVGYKPFHTDAVWKPLAVLSSRKSYILDHQLYGSNMREIWQNSRQAYFHTRGDCEDHAIILADWLIALGHDARVVLGNHRGGGHAWVVLFKDGREMILEATSKKPIRGINDFVSARLATQYRPMYQFNRNHFWVNTGSTFTTNYKDEKWQLRSRFSRDKRMISELSSYSN